MLTVFVLAGIFYLITAPAWTQFDEHLRVAKAMLNGHLYVDGIPPYLEGAHFNGHVYIVHPPLPSLMMLPLATHITQSVFSIVIGAWSVALVWRLTSHIAPKAAIWLTLFFALGTSFWYDTTLGASWNLSVVTSVPFTLMALLEITEKRRSIVIGLLAGSAALSRYDMVLAIPVYILLCEHRRAGWVLLGVLPAAILYFILNELKYGTLTDIGIFIFAQHDGWLRDRLGGGSPLALRFVPVNLYALLFMAPTLNGTWPYIHPQMQGQALLLTSPAFLLALKPSLTRLTAGVGCAAMLVMGPVLLWYGNGFVQFGMRFYIQAFPFLILLMALGAKQHGMDQMGKALILGSIMLCAYGMWHIKEYGLAT